jgi:hypothetical protein
MRSREDTRGLGQPMHTHVEAEALHNLADYLTQQKTDGWVLTTAFLADPGMKHPPAGQTSFGSLVDRHDIYANIREQRWL